MPLTADEILRRSAEVYANCSSYRDEGVVTTVFIHGPRPFERRTRRQPFRTRFVRPNLWRFEYWNEEVGPRSEWRHYVIWTDDRGHHSWWTLRPENIEDLSIDRLFAGATGISSGAARTVPSLLQPSDKPSLADGFVLEGEEDLVDHKCFRLIRHVGEHRGATMWVDCESLLIRRLFSRTDFDTAQRDATTESMRRFNAHRLASGQLPLEEDRPTFSRERDFTTETTTDYHPLINTPIDPAEFHFTPPT